MNSRKRILTGLLALSIAGGTTTAQTKTNQNGKQAFINNLIKKMTLEEKIGQLNLLTSEMDVTGPFMNAGYKKDIEDGRCGSIFNAYTPQYTRQLQDMAMKTRLKIPLLFGYDVIHGHKTIFPIPLGEACTWDMALMEKSARIAAVEASADGLQWTYSPMVDIARDPRWGRVAEGVGEDTWYGVQVAKAKVKGYQGTDLSLNNTILACVKHFALYGAVEAGRDYNTVDMSRQKMYEYYLPPYKAAVDAGVATVMTSFNEVDGIPATGNKWLMTDLLRRQWGFKGFVVTDYTAINEMMAHGVGDEYKVGELALNAGVDMDMQGSVYTRQLAKLVADKKITMAQVDTCVYRILSAKYDLGLFKDPYLYCDNERPAKEILTPENRATAREIGARSIVLLKNQQELLPLKKGAKIALIGPLADSKRDMIGNWSAAGDYTKSITLLEGIKQKLGGAGNVTYLRGAHYTNDTTLLKRALQKAVLTAEDTANSAGMLAEAVALAQQSDIVVLALGESYGMSGEAASRSNISIPENQEKLLRAVYATGKPVVLVLMNGRPLTLEWEDAHIPAIVETWFLGTEAGNSIADVLFGDYNPAGKLTMTFPRSVGQIPIYYNHKNTGRPEDPANKYSSKYLDITNEPLYPFGYGLSYTKFTYGPVQLDKNQLKQSATGNVKVSVAVTNSGNYDGEEVVQLYIRDKVASVTRPVKELKNFKKIFLKKGETRTVTFELSVNDLKFYNKDLKYVSEPGDFSVFVGGNSRDTQSADFALVP
ncbi:MULTISPECIES: beta-glucosidase BglX [unclassified Chitinophaga]|uniref:beta-glucosidase BglX n=1 Tax=unclassified Chitinophaga TaxID=2619133 RepID=UPI0009D0BCC7|nr:MULTISPECIES: beta-glucosidase BglX [unclassified Chitinophaga]OMP80378.1 beta-glucosidase [[Flexibacter] sp. ATCC 35208]WPV69751.1 beta-glucosidase BglX [Chitinophaga sp. LS1]